MKRLVLGLSVSACVYNPRPLPPRPVEDVEGCEQVAKAKYRACFAGGGSDRACAKVNDEAYLTCLMYDGRPDGGEVATPTLPGVYR